MDFKFVTNKNGQPIIETTLSDYSLMSNPLLNKGTAFTEAERSEFHLFGLLPPQVGDLVTQRQRSYGAFKNRETNLDKYMYLRDLQDSNETLFYSLLNEYITEMLPIVYTPTVGLGCQQFSHVYRRPRGIYIAYPYQDHMDEILANPSFNQVEVIVVTDGERILGLGDQGAGGMGIPIGKLALYSACAGIYPANTLPILLDVGTNNANLLNDKLYIGWKHERIRGKEYTDFIDKFVTAIKKRFPRVVLQWEDFSQQNATPILERYHDQLCTFNDDIQGTATVATGTLLAAIQVAGTNLRSQKIVVVGAGSAGVGISNLIMQAMINDGLSEEEARSRFYLLNSKGLLVEGAQNVLSFQQKFLQNKSVIANWKLESTSQINLKDVVDNVHPTVLLGVSGQPAIFTEEIVHSMAAHVNRPIIFPLSNPTSQCEAVPNDLIKWTNGKAIIGTGSPFPEVMRNGKPFRIDQANNSYVFPGIGLGLIATQATRITDKMFMAAAVALAKCSPAKNDPQANLLPPFTEIREISFQVALAVAKEAVASGFAQKCSDEELEKKIRAKMWMPEYLEYKKV